MKQHCIPLLPICLPTKAANAPAETGVGEVGVEAGAKKLWNLKLKLKYLMKTAKNILGVAVALAMTASGALADFYQGFETDTNGWYGVNRVATLSHNGVPSHSGGFYTQAPTYPNNSSGPAEFTRWGGYSYIFPIAGFKTDIWVYLNPTTPAPGATSGMRFDWSTAIDIPNDCDPSTNFRRDFIFNVGWYNDTGTGHFVVSPSNNAPGDPIHGNNPFTITTPGWYKLETVFDNDGGILRGTFSVYDSANTLLQNASQKASWVLKSADDMIGTTVGGNRYGWFATQEFPFLAFDDTSLTGFQFYCEDGNGPVAGIGYWTNHLNAWYVPSITIGDHTYSKAGAVALMQKPTAGDMSYQLFSQLVAAELNVYGLHSNASCVADAIQAADSFLTTHAPGSGVKASDPVWKAIVSAYNVLVNYN